MALLRFNETRAKGCRKNAANPTDFRAEQQMLVLQGSLGPTTHSPDSSPISDAQQPRIPATVTGPSTRSAASGASLNRTLAIAISVPICVFVLLGVVAVAIYCSKLHRPHRKDATRRHSQQERDSVPPTTATPTGEGPGGEPEHDASSPDIKAIFKALKPSKSTVESGSVPTGSTQVEPEQSDQRPKSTNEYRAKLDSSSDGGGTHFSDLEDPFIDHAETSTSSERTIARAGDPTKHRDTHV